MAKILVSMIAYRERYLAESVRDCVSKAANPQDLVFSIVSEQSKPELHADLSFLPTSQIVYRKYDLSEFRGIMWSRAKTTDVDFEYDYILYTCGHNLFAQDWDLKVLDALKKAETKAEKALITSSGPEFEYNSDETLNFEPRSGRTVNKYRPRIPSDYVPGYGFPNSLQAELPNTEDVVEDAYMQWSFVFAPSNYVKEVPIDIKMGYHGEEIYLSVISWARGWKFFATPEILYYHDTYKQYPGEEAPTRMNTHRPWIDLHQKSFWEHSDHALRRLNLLLSGELHDDVPLQKVLDFCKATGMSTEYCKKFEDYSNIGLERHAEGFRNMQPYLED